jgi:hypothetical protein
MVKLLKPRGRSPTALGAADGPFHSVAPVTDLRLERWWSATNWIRRHD